MTAGRARIRAINELIKQDRRICPTSARGRAFRGAGLGWQMELPQTASSASLPGGLRVISLDVW